MTAPGWASDTASLRRLQLYLTANTITVTVASALLVVCRLTLVRNGWILALAAAVGGSAALLAVASRLLRRGRPGPALSLAAAANWVTSVIAVAITPFTLAPVVLTLLLPVVTTLPYSSRRRMVITASGAVISSVICAVLARWRPIDGPERLAPRWLLDAIVITFVPLVAALAVFSAWRTHLDLEARAEELRRSRARLVAASDQARRGFERDLHDGAQQQLSAVTIRLGLLRSQLADQPALAAAVDQVEADLSTAVDELRNLARGIYPPLLTQRGLGEALRAAALRSAVPVDLQLPTAGLSRQAPAVEAAVYFACLEALQNAARHSGAARIHLSVKEGAALEFAVRDDGIGFDPATIGEGSGLMNVADRLGSVGGRLAIDAAAGKGTELRGVVPLGG